MYSGEDESDKVYDQELRGVLRLERGDFPETESPSSVVMLSASSNEKKGSITDEVKANDDKEQLSESEVDLTSEETTYCVIS